MSSSAERDPSRARPHSRGRRPTGTRAGAADRAVSPVVGVVLLVAVTAILAATAGATVLSGTAVDGQPARASIDCTATAATDRVACVHEGGDRLDVRELTVRIEVAGEPLADQPPVPFFAARGFHGGPTGPFNSAADPYWSAGEAAAVRLAGTNRPGITPGDTVTVRLTRADRVIAEATATAG